MYTRLIPRLADVSNAGCDGRPERPRGGPSGSLDRLQDVLSAAMKGADGDSFIESLMDTNLYSMGAYFSDQHPELVDEVIDQSVAIEEEGIRAYANTNGISPEECFETLMTGLAVRYYKAIAS
jgi:hypothetical protein